MSRDDLVAMVGTLGAPHGVERSVKIGRDFINDDRCLVSVDRAALGASPAVRLTEMARALVMPGDFVAALPAALAAADVVHFGYEGPPESAIHKIYLESASATRDAMRREDPAPRLVHTAFKWMPRRPDRRAVARYTWIPCRTRHDLEDRLGRITPPHEAPVGHRLAVRLLARLAHVVEPERLFLLEVAEENNQRRSWDINVYNGGLRVGQALDLIDAARAEFRVSPAAASAVFDANADRTLGHLSGGLGRDGQEFATIYFGVEAR